MNVLGHFNYWIFIFLMMVGFYTIIARGNLVKKTVGLTIFQTSVFIFFISLGKVIGGTAPILVGGVEHETVEASETATGATDAPEATRDSTQAVQEVEEALGDVEDAAQAATAGRQSTTADGTVYSNPLPHVLILTAIVVGIATTALALALVVRIDETYGTVEEDEIHDMDLEFEAVA